MVKKQEYIHTVEYYVPVKKHREAFHILILKNDYDLLSGKKQIIEGCLQILDYGERNC